MRLLIYEASYRRLQAAIDGLGREVEPVLMDAAAALSLDDAPVSLEDAAIEAAWANNETFFGPVARDFSRALLKSPTLKWLQSGAAGFDHPIFGQLVERGVRLATSHGQAVGIADYVLWGVLDHLQRGPERRAAQGAADWKRGLRFREIAGGEWLVIGFGAIGQGVGARARAFGARVTGIRRDPSPHPAADLIAGQADIAALLPRADVVVLSVPLTAETRHLVDAAFLAAMKPRSVLVNVGRGGLIDEAALLAALEKGVPEHAVLDVFDTEPLPEDSPFWSHPRVTATSHLSGATEGQAARNDEVFLENLRRYLAGETLISEIAPTDVLAAR
ncbi:D-2-hydroxyacid dehydrogenase [Phenylobacterium sp.]|uniref:D-2-hydroxyacid dehydrogenase n=1 Tax=Phenylobacterium sp. TaxID=1871053 RepID=UPI002DE70BB9|nr:D-2-hydroxyacid dehydrogenase [Phenylobacterium sp.]